MTLLIPQLEQQKLQQDECLDLTARSLNAYGEKYPVWCVFFSGGKDSTAVLTTTIHLIQTGRVKPPDRLLVYYADTRLDLPLLQLSAQAILDKAVAFGCEIYTATAPIEQRLLQPTVMDIINQSFSSNSINFYENSPSNNRSHSLSCVT